MANNDSEKITIGVLGPEHTFTDIAADLYIKKKLRKKASKKLFSSIWDVFDSLKNKIIDFGIVPIENSIQGTVRESFDAFFNFDIKIIYKFSLPVNHCFAVKRGTKKGNIRKIVTHNQAMHQCRKFLRKNYPDAQLISFSSTAEAIHNCLSDADFNKAVICSKQAALNYSLDIIDENIEDRKGNKTWFAVLANKKAGDIVKTEKNIQTSIAFYFHKDKPGTLFGVFKDFADLKVNMTKIESRPAPKEMGDYIFFLDFEGDLNDRKVSELLKRISQKVAVLKNFGSYEVG